MHDLRAPLPAAESPGLFQGHCRRRSLSTHTSQVSDNSPFSFCSRINMAADGVSRAEWRWREVCLLLLSWLLAVKKHKGPIFCPWAEACSWIFPLGWLYQHATAQLLLYFLRCHVKPSGSNKKEAGSAALKQHPTHLRTQGFS